MTMIRDIAYRRQFQDTLLLYYPHLAKQAAESETFLAVKTITFVVTEGCTLDCSYCYQVDKNHQAIMSKETAMQAIDMILDDSKMEGYINSKETPGVIIDFIGGEPLLQIDLMDFICDYFRYKTMILDHPWSKYYMFNVTTNGTLYMTDKVQRWMQKNKGNLSLTITIDGNKELHDACRVFPDGRGSYDIVQEAIKHAINVYSLKTSKVTLAPENIMYTFEAIKHLYQMGLNEINSNVVYENVWVPDRDAPIFYDQLIKLADWLIDEKYYQDGYVSLFDANIGRPMPLSENQNWCGGNGQMLAIGTDGRLFPCIRFMKYSLSNKDREEYEIGHVKIGVEKEENNIYLQDLAQITRTSQSTDECINCQVARGCAWCTAYNYDVYGTANKRATFICWLHKARVLANYYYWNKIYKLEGVKDQDFPLNLNEEEILRITKGDERWKNF